MKIKLNVVIVLLMGTINMHSQIVSRQMISSQGASITTSSGLKVSQTIGQLSVTGNFKEKYVVQQGYQQSFWQAHLSNSISTILDINLYPNPASEILNIDFPDITNRPINVRFYDINGRLVYNQNLKIENSKLILKVSQLKSALYLVKLEGVQINYHSKIFIK